MAEIKHRKSNGAVKKGVAVYKEPWMIKVMANGHSPQAKLIFERIATFGEAGCWMHNETFCEEYHRTEDTIRRAITSLWSKGDIIVMGWNGHGRKMYAAGHPKVRPEINRLFNEAKKAGKVENIEQFNRKIRLRAHEAIPVESKVNEPQENVERTPKGLKYYQDKRQKNAVDGDIETQ
ncbi:hypothetical protein LCGC14_1088820 [marine sediment metagenome]|uniref:Helix-turn-helix domain-containing protein n=1 Tax=marine sediment metagenome TaxID=412755 RepID=A0A0F9PW78_9ZZZZ